MRTNRLRRSGPGIFYVCLGSWPHAEESDRCRLPARSSACCFCFSLGQLFSWPTWQKLRPISGTVLVLLIAAPWHILATLRNPPYFAWTLKSMAGHYHGFLWFYFINEQLLRFLNLRYPRDYDTVPRVWFWLFHLVWLFPWSVYLPAVSRLSFKPVDRAGKVRLLALCWIGFVLVFFTFSTTQEYYSMPCYPAFALLLGSAMAEEGGWIRGGTRAFSMVAVLPAIACFSILFAVRHVPTPGDITAALSVHPNAYKLSLGHMEDLTVDSFAYLRVPLDARRRGLPFGCDRCAQHEGLAALPPGVFRRCRDDGHIFSGGSSRDGQIRSIALLQGLCARDFARSARSDHSRSQLLVVFFGPFLHGKVRALTQWPMEQP